jgi:riboflavin kinase
MIAMDELLFFLLKKGGHRNAIRMTTAEIGAGLGMSQQNASRKLMELEQSGLVKRNRSGISLTQKAMDDIADLKALLNNAFEPKLDMQGKIVKGLGEGRFYLSQEGYKRQMEEKLGFEPYPGTLNIKLDGEGIESRRRMLQLEPLIIDGFEKDGRKFGELFAYIAVAGGFDCAIVVPLRTHHGNDVVEVIAPVNLRKALKKREGDSVILRIK